MGYRKERVGFLVLAAQEGLDRDEEEMKEQAFQTSKGKTFQDCKTFEAGA